MVFVIPTTSIQYSESEGAGVGPANLPHVAFHGQAEQDIYYRRLWLEQFPLTATISREQVFVFVDPRYIAHSTWPRSRQGAHRFE
jgi:hypothetical protein